MRLSICALSLTLCAAGCTDPGQVAGPDAGLAGGPAVQGSPARGDLVINEVAPRPTRGPDWIELYNRSAAALDLCDYFVTDDLDRLDHYAPLGGVAPPEPCPPLVLEAGAYRLIYADDDAAAGPDHAPFKLGRDDQVHVVTTGGVASDSFIYLYTGVSEGDSLARSPSGDGPFYPAQPSPGAANPDPPESAAEVLP
ncbi:MAG: lamin tail domain-containing protein [Myxococcota bacterium]